MMENYNIEDDDCGLFITQTPRESDELGNLSSFIVDNLEEDFEMVKEGYYEGVGATQYSDISEPEDNITDKDLGNKPTSE